MVCPHCGADGAEDARFCWSCGTSLRSRADERRLVTVLFADLVGFTSLSETLDPEQVKQLVDRAFERLVRDVTSFGGQIDKIVGDAIVALFGAPTAHEDDAGRAVRAALRMQQTLAAYAAEVGVDIRMRVGVNTGEVLVGSLRAGGDYTAMGDVVNIASRLQTSADPGTVLVGEATYALTRDTIAYESRGALIARGREQPVNVWVATGSTLPPGYRTPRRVVPLIGREAERATLANAIEVSVRHRRAQLVLLLGEAGIGKTRLAEEVGVIVGELEPDAIVLTGRCVPYGEANPWWPIADALRDGLGLDIDAPLDVARDRTSRVLDRLLDDPAQVSTVTNGILHLMGYEGPVRALEPARVRVEATQALLTFLEASVRRQTLVIRLADLHWADDLVLELIDELSAQLARTGLVVVATARRSLLRRWTPRSGRHNVLVLNIDPLDDEGSEMLLDALGGDRLPVDLRRTLLDRAGGNPFYLEELVSLVIDRADEPDATVEVPDTLRGLLAARLDALTLEEQMLLEAAAVWGSSGSLKALEKIAEHMTQGVDLLSVLDSLERKEILDVEGDHWSFRSDLIREVAYGRLTKHDRLERHHGIAAYLDVAVAGRFIDDSFVDTVARHYAEAARLSLELGPEPDVPADLVERAIRWQVEAARRAEHSAAWPLAARLYGQGLALAIDAASEVRLPLLLGRAHARAETWDFAGARADASEALELAEQLNDPLARGQALLRLGEAGVREGDVEETTRVLTAAIEQFDRAGDVEGRADALRLSGMAALFRSDYGSARGPVTEALEAYRRSGDRRGEAWALQNLAWIAFATGKVTEAEGRLEESAALFTEAGDTGGLAWAMGLLAFVRFFQGRFEEAAELARTIVREAQRRGDQWAQSMMRIVLASVELWSGRTDAAVEVIEEALEGFGRLGDPVGREQALALHGRALVMQGRVRRGLEVIRSAATTPGARAGEEAARFAAVNELVAGVQLGDLGISGEHLDLIAEIDWSQPADLGQAEIAVGVALALAQRGSLEEAAELLDRVLADRANGSAWAARAMVAAGQQDRERLEESLQRLEDAVGVTYHDRALAAIAAGLSGAGSVGERFKAARDLLDPTDDVLTRAVLTLAEATVAEAVGSEDAAEARSRAERAWTHLGVDPVGWRRLFEFAVTSAA